MKSNILVDADFLLSKFHDQFSGIVEGVIQTPIGTSAESVHVRVIRSMPLLVSFDLAEMKLWASLVEGGGAAEGITWNRLDISERFCSSLAKVFGRYCVEERIRIQNSMDDFVCCFSEDIVGSEMELEEFERLYHTAFRKVIPCGRLTTLRSDGGEEGRYGLYHVPTKRPVKFAEYLIYREFVEMATDSEARYWMPKTHDEGAHAFFLEIVEAAHALDLW